MFLVYTTVALKHVSIPSLQRTQCPALSTKFLVIGFVGTVLLSSVAPTDAVNGVSAEYLRDVSLQCYEAHTINC